MGMKILEKYRHFIQEYGWYFLAISVLGCLISALYKGYIFVPFIFGALMCYKFPNYLRFKFAGYFIYPILLFAVFNKANFQLFFHNFGYQIQKFTSFEVLYISLLFFITLTLVFKISFKPIYFFVTLIGAYIAILLEKYIPFNLIHEHTYAQFSYLFIVQMMASVIIYIIFNIEYQHLNRKIENN